jgi:hypothetical protein
MARSVDKDKFLGKLPEQFRTAVRSESDFKLVSTMWKMDDDHIKQLFASIPDKLKPLFDWKINKPGAKRGNRSNLPYETEVIKLTVDLMKCSPGATIVAEDGVSGTLLTVQVLAKLEVGGQIKTFSISNIDHIESKK